MNGAKEDGYYQINLIREERTIAKERAKFQQIFEHREDFHDAGFDPADAEIELRREASRDVLRLYKGSFASLATPMGRFMAMGPTHDTHSWMAKRTMEESGIDDGDLEALDLRKLASEMMHSDATGAFTDTGEGGRAHPTAATAGSPQASSDTLTVSQLREERRKRDTPRIRKRIGMRKHKTGGEAGSSSRGAGK
jgi:hypothetical protein